MFDCKVALRAGVIENFKQVAERFTHVGYSADDYREWKRVRSELCAAK
jgi:fibrillarin-like rRNA methylase